MTTTPAIGHNSGLHFDMTPEEGITLQGVRTLMDMAYATASFRGWHNNVETGQYEVRPFPISVALMHSELSEALEAHRRSAQDDKLPHRNGVEVELADCVLRIMDTAKAMGLDLAGALIEKNRYNRDRVDHSKDARTAPGGKKY